MIFLLLYNFIRTDDTMICNDINTNSFSDNNLMAGMYTPNKEMLSCRSAGQPDKLPSNIPFINTGSTQGSYTPTSYIQVGQPVYSGTAGTTYTPQQSQYTYSPTSSSYQLSSVPAAQVPLSSPLNINALQPINDKKFVSPCDNTDDEDMFKECIKKALKSLRSIINNCKKTLGNVEICCIDDKCLESLKGIPFGKDACEVRKERMCKDECHGQSLYGGSKDSCNKHKDDCDGHKDDCDMHTDRCDDDEDKDKKKRRKSKDKKKGKRKRRRHGRRDGEEEEEDDDDSTASYSDEDEYESRSEKRKDKDKRKKKKTKKTKKTKKKERRLTRALLS
ncbi:hypothetical protein THOM_2374 [Trachipleistophora hominis]|uniref:Uncharacterized protein n=1 Tax=Trachipleistophora hominis TaxID=72359 RepID=L7JVD3_TRAHO|nr:hypothetical protein THOM_2374 [Trachipleistophora hominis]